MKKLPVLVALLALGVANAETTTLEHKSGGKTEVRTTAIGTEVKSTSKSTGGESNTQGNKTNVARVKQEGRDRGDPVVKQNGKAVKP